MASERILELLRRPSDPDEHDAIRELWKTHSIAEDNRDLPGLLSTLTTDCVYTVAGTGRAVGRARGRLPLLYGASHGVPGHPFRPRLHRDRTAGRLRGGDRQRHTSGTLARARANRREADVAERHLLPVGSGRRALQGRDGLHGPDAAGLSSRRELPHGAPPADNHPQGHPRCPDDTLSANPCRSGAGSVPKA